MGKSALELGKKNAIISFLVQKEVLSNQQHRSPSDFDDTQICVFWTSQAGGESAREMINKAVQPQQAPPQAPAASAPAAGKNCTRPADEPPTPPAGDGAEAGACYPAPCEGVVPRPAASKPGRYLG